MSEQKIISDKRIDIRGEVCPYTFIKSKLAIEEMAPGQLLEVVVSHLPAVENVPRSMENEGHEVVSVEQETSSDWKIVIRKKAEG